jgi:hypothetical protein
MFIVGAYLFSYSTTWIEFNLLMLLQYKDFIITCNFQRFVKQNKKVRGKLNVTVLKS